MNKLLKILCKRFLVIMFVIFTFFVVASGNKKGKIISYNTNNVKSVQAVHIVNKYNSLVKNKEPRQADNFWEAIRIAVTEPVSFMGLMTSYGPDCEGCGGRSGCPPRQDLTNGNIYFDDNSYGRVRVVATDPSIPCGSMLRITSGLSTNPMYAIALDRGGAIKENKVDLLYESNEVAAQAGTQYNVKFEIIRWGW